MRGEKCPDDKPFWNASIKKCVGCVTDKDCTGENELCLVGSPSNACNSTYDTCKKYTIHAKTTINGKEWIYVHVDNPNYSHDQYWASWNDIKKVCTHLNKQVPTASEMINDWPGLKGWDTCLNSWDCGYTHTDLALPVFNNLVYASARSIWLDEDIDGCSAVTMKIKTDGSTHLGSFGQNYDNNGVQAVCHD